MREDIPYATTAGYAQLVETQVEQSAKQEVSESAIIKRAIKHLENRKKELELISSLDERDENFTIKEQIAINKRVSEEISLVIAYLQPFNN